MLPISVNTVALFMSHLVVKGLSTSTITTYISAIGYIHKLGSFNDPTQFFLIWKMLAGLRKHNAKPNIRHPITIYILHKLIDALDNVCPSLYNKLMLKAMCLLAFDAFLRIGEIAFNGKEANILKITD